MKNLLNKYIFIYLSSWYRIIRSKSKFRKMNTSNVFTEIYKANLWKSQESISGPGSETIQTESLIKGLNKLIEDFNITSILDIPCGDFNWMKKVNLNEINYTGADIIEELIKKNIEQFKERENLKFKVLNLITDTLPKSDLIVVRDCLVHFSYIDIYKAIKNIKSSGSKFLFTTTFTDRDLNSDIITGEWRPVNLQKKPFYFPSPLLIINENCNENDGIYKDKSMALWALSKINI